MCNRRWPAKILSARLRDSLQELLYTAVARKVEIPQGTDASCCSLHDRQPLWSRKWNCCSTCPSHLPQSCSASAALIELQLNPNFRKCDSSSMTVRNDFSSVQASRTHVMSRYAKYEDCLKDRYVQSRYHANPGLESRFSARL